MAHIHLATNPRAVIVAGMPKGDIYKRFGRWHWFNEKRGIETWPRKTTLVDVKTFIARVCLVTPADVKIGRPQWLPDETA